MEARFLTSALRRFSWLIVVFALIGTAAGGAVSFLSARQYQATASISVQQPNLSLLTSSQAQLEPAQYVATQVGVIQSNTIAQAVATNTHLTLLAVQHALAVSQRQSSDIIDITASRPGATGAAQLANLVAYTYLSQEQGQVNGLLSRATSALQARLSSIERQITDLQGAATTAPTANVSANLAALQTQAGQVSQDLTQVEVTTEVALANTQLVNTAFVPISPKPRHTALKGALGFGGGLILGVVLAVLLAASKPRMLRARDVEDAIGISAAAELPHVPSWRGVVNATNWRDHAGFSDEATKVCVFVEAARSARNCKTVLVTSLERRSGVSIVAGALAGMLGDGSERVELVSLAALHERDNGAPPEQLLPFGRERMPNPFDQPSSAAGTFLLKSKVGSWLSETDYEADVLVVDGGNLRDSMSAVTLARTVDVTVLVVPLPNQNERYLNAVLRATFGDAKGQLLVVTNNVSGQGSRRVRASA